MRRRQARTARNPAVRGDVLGGVTAAPLPTPPPPRWLFGIVLAAIALLFAVGWFVLVLLSGLACDGDGGSPYAARASTVGELCKARDGGWAEAPWVAGVLLAPVALAVGGIVAVVRRSWVLLVAGAAASVGLLLAV